MATYAQLKKQIEQLNKQADAARQLEKSGTLAKVREAIAAFELTVEEVFGTAAKSAKKKTLKSAAPKRHTPKGAGQAKYRDPKSGAVWTGFGRAPLWLASVKDRTKFLIAQAPAAEVKPAEQVVVKFKKKVTAKKASSASKVKPVSKKATQVVKATKKTAPAAPKATAKAPTKKAAKAVEVVKPKISVKVSPKPAAKVMPATAPDQAAPPQVADAV